MNPNQPRDVKRLCAAAAHSRKALEPFRKNRVAAVREFVGHHYSGSGSDDRVPINLLELAISIYARQLAAARPQALITTRHRSLRPFATVFEAAVNDAIVESRLEQTARQMVIDALFSMGIVKVGLCEGEMVELNGSYEDVGRIYADCIGLDDWVHDMTARSWGDIQYCGNRWTMRLDRAKDYKLFAAKTRAKLAATEPSQRDENGDVRASAISRGEQLSGADEQEYHARIELWDYWLPDENLLITVAQGMDEPLRIIEWDGPNMGPYHRLSYTDVPDSVMPLPPVANMRDIHDLTNRLFRKAGRQAERQKTILGVGGQAAEDGTRIVEANDGEAVRLDNPTNAKEYKFGGAEPVTLAFILQLKDMFGYLNGNLDALGGLSPQAKTLGQDELLHASANQRIADMQDRTVSAIKSIIESISWYIWTDPVRTRVLNHTIPGTDIEVEMQWTPETRKGEFVLYNFDIHPFSMQHSTPGMKLQGVTNYLERLVYPVLPMMQAQGKAIDFDALTKTVARLGNLPELESIIVDGGMPPAPTPEASPTGDPNPKAAVTTRKYERINRPGATQQGKDSVMMRALLGVDSQESEMATVGRSNG